MNEQDRVAANDLNCDPAYRLLDLAAEVGELAADLNDATGYGDDAAAAAVSSDEVGDALFALLAVADGLEVDAGAALDEALAKYERRIADSDSPASGGE